MYIHEFIILGDYLYYISHYSWVMSINHTHIL